MRRRRLKGIRNMERQRDKDGRVIFTEEMRKEFTILAPVMSPIHFGIIEKVFTNHGYNLKMLYTTNKEIVDTGLQNVHNDTCYPALLVVGQLLEAINSGEYDKSKLAVMITQTGGGCRASNYIHLLRRALKKNGLDYIPVISLNATGMEKNPGFKLNLQFLAELMYAVIYGDALMLLSHQTRPYEVHKGDTDALIKKWTDRLNGNLKRFLRVKKNMIAIVKDFAAIPMERTEKIRVGIVGEIYVKFAPLGNNNLEKFLEHEDVEIVVPSLLDFMLYCCNHRIEDRELYGIRTFKQIGSFFGEKILLYFQKLMNRVVKRYSAFRPAGDFRDTKKGIRGYVNGGNKMGEGWLLTGEMLELINSGVMNIICTQPFGCLPNHIAGKGMIRRIREDNPGANIVALDYDPGPTKINQENRIKLMLSIAEENREKSDENRSVKVS